MTARFLIGDVFDRLAEVEDGSVDLVVTSPPFLALRSYLPADHPDKGKEIGSESTPAEFLDVLLRVTEELRRVLAPHGSVCIELGDTYASMGINWHKSEAGFGPGRLGGKRSSGALAEASPLPAIDRVDGWPLAKSKTLIPELYRIALAYGINPLTGQQSPAGQWRIRNVVTWARPNPPVGALGDKWRPATSDVVVACTSPKRYWDDLATRKTAPVASPRHYYGSAEKGPGNQTKSTDNGEHRLIEGNPSGAPLLDYWEIPLLDGEEPKRYGPKEKPKAKGTNWNSKDGPNESRNDNGAGNFRPSEATELAGTPLLDYWEIPPTGYSGSHYAVYPPALVEPLVKAMCPPKVCRTCGEPSRRITEDSYEAHGNGAQQNAEDYAQGQQGQYGGAQSMSLGRATKISQTMGWTDCGHDNWRPGLILDPFAGSGTTLLVATGHGHDAVGIDLDSRNAELALERVGPFLLEVEA